MINKIIQGDCLEVMRTMADCSVDIIFTDPPYAMGSKVIIKNGKPEYQKAADFMGKWAQPNGEFWEEWFTEAMRILKYGGRVLMFGIDRQSWFNAYYACNAGFEKQMSLYWYFISNFPKAADLSKAIDKNAGAEREIVGKKNLHSYKSKSSGNSINEGLRNDFEKVNTLTAPKTDLAKKYDGYKYSVAPLKQVVEEIAIFQKPYKTGSCLHDTLAYENGDKECLCGALDIDGNRVEFVSAADRKESTQKNQHEKFGTEPMTDNTCYGDFSMIQPKDYNPTGRFPPQTFVDSDVADLLDKQSGLNKSSGGDGSKFSAVKRNALSNNSLRTTVKDGENGLGFGDIGGCSKILPKCDYDTEDFDLYIYCPKVSKEERNFGCGELEKKQTGTFAQDEWSRNNMGNTPDNKRDGNQNNHPTVKPQQLLIKILKLFKTPNPQVVLDCFAGSGSIPMACVELGIDFIAIELNPLNCEIAEARVGKTKLHTDVKSSQVSMF